jgi:hypothetical protein
LGESQNWARSAPAPDVVSKVAGDFGGWTDHAKYSKAFPRFLEALNRPQQGSNTA